MRSICTLPIVCLGIAGMLACLWACGDPSEPIASETCECGCPTAPPCPDRPVRAATQSCAPAPFDPHTLPAITPIEKLAYLGLDRMTALMEIPDLSGRFLAAQQQGLIQRIERVNGSWTARNLLDIQDSVGCCDREGLLAAALSPDFALDRALYTLRTTQDRPTRVVIERHKVEEDLRWVELSGRIEIHGEPLPTVGLAGGALAFDSGGNLLVALGSDDAAAPRTGRVLRFDVRDIETTGTIAFPTDNPDPDSPLWAEGMGEVRGCAWDGPSEALWCVSREEGQDAIRAIQGGDLRQFEPLDAEPVEDPACGRIGGIVYRGSNAPELWGAYVYGEQCGGGLSGLRSVDGVVRKASLGALGTDLARFALDKNEEIFPLEIGTRVFKVTLTDPDTALGWPDTLSQTGCFDSLDPPVLSKDLIAYDVNAPLWTDGAIKTRFVSVPPGQTIRVESDGSWVFPLGSVIVKNFAFEMADGVRRIVETRVMVLQPFGWSFHTYEWNDAGTEATLLDGIDGVVRELDLVQGGVSTALKYRLPNRTGCHACHARTAVSVIAFKPRQLDKTLQYSDGAANQLDALWDAGLFDGAREPLPEPFIDPHDPEQPLERRARSYLETNCGHCHQPGGWAPPGLGLDLRMETPLADTGTCNVPRKYTSYGTVGELRIAPGNLADSNLYQRMIHEGPGQMPPIGVTHRDPLIDVVIGPWIAAMQGCP